MILYELSDVNMAYIYIYIYKQCVKQVCDWDDVVWLLQPKNKDKDKDKDKGQGDDDKKQEGEKLGCGRVIPIKQVRTGCFVQEEEGGVVGDFFTINEKCLTVDCI